MREAGVKPANGVIHAGDGGGEINSGKRRPSIWALKRVVGLEPKGRTADEM